MAEAPVRKASGPARTSMLEAAILKRALTRGSEFVLTSGRQSKFYFDMKNCACDPSTNELLAAEIAAHTNLSDFDFLCGVMLGAIPIATAVSLLSEPRLPLVIVREKSKEHGTRKRIEGIRSTADLLNKRVLILEDVTSTGGSIVATAEALREAGAIVEAAITIVLRNASASERLREVGINLTHILHLTDENLEKLL